MNISQLRRSLKDKAAQEIAELKSLELHRDDYDEKILTNEYHPIPPQSFAEAALPFLDMAKDARDTFRPYKRPRHVKRDALQLYYGAKNLMMGCFLLPCTGVLGLCFAGIATIGAALLYPFTANTARGCLRVASNLLYSAGVSLANSVSYFIRGATQVMTSPLTLLRMGFRMAWFKNTPYRNDYETPKFREALNNVNTLLDSAPPICNSSDMLTALKKVYDKDKDRHSEVLKEIKANTNVIWHDFETLSTTRTLPAARIPLLSSAAQVQLFTSQKKTNTLSISSIPRGWVKDYVNSFQRAP